MLYLYSLFENLILMRVTLTKTDSRTGKESCNLLTVKALMERVQSPTKADRSNLERYRQAVPLLHGMRAGNGYADRLPLVCPALEYAADGQEVKRYNGIVLLEADGLTGSGEAVQVKAQARLLPQTVAALTGADGRSVKILAAFSLPDGTLPQKRGLYGPFHAHAYRLAVACYQALLPFPVTLKEALPETRFRLSMDEEAYYNPQATPFCMEQPQAFPGEMTFAESRKRQGNPLARLEPGTDTLLSVRQLYEAALSHAIDATEGWKRGNDLRPLLVNLAETCFHAGIPEEETVCQTLMHYPDADRFVLRTLIHTLYKECRGTRRGAAMTAEQAMLLRMEEFMERRFEFRLNTVTEEVEYRRRDSMHFQFRPADRRARNSIAMDALKEGIAVWDRDVDRYLGSDRIPVYNPVEDYLWGTGKWDGRDRIRELADCVPCAEGEQWRTFFRRWFLGMVAHWRGMDRQHGNSTVPLLVGAQGCRKSTFCRILLPPELRFAYTDSLDFRSKRDAELALGRFLLVNLDEFDQIGDRQQGFLKHLLQKPTVKVRKPYAASIEEVRRYASFIATSNHTDLLKDPSGSRRFICIEVTGTIRTDIRIDYRQLYAQAMQALNTGERYWMDDADEAALTRANRRFEQQTPVEVALCSMLQPAPSDSEGEELTLIEIAELLNARSKTLKLKLTAGVVSNLGKLMQKYKFTYRRTNRGKLYRVIHI